MRQVWQWVTFFLSLLVFGAVGRLCVQKTEGFTCLKVQNNFSEEVVYHSPLTAEVRAILNQDFRYYKRGAQSFVFLSADGNYVLKVFNNRLKRQRLLLHYLLFSYPKKKAIEKRLHTTFNSYRIAAATLQNETGVVFAHLSPDPTIDLHITLIDRLAIKHTLSSKQSGFLLQKKSELVYPAIKRCMSEGKIERAKEIIDSLITVVSTCHEKGIVNEDPSIRKNFGLQRDCCMVVDVGRFAEDVALRDPQCAESQKKHHLKRFRKYLKKNYPELMEYLDVRMAS